MDNKKIEKAAIRYCELMGLDPHEIVVHGAPGDPRTGAQTLLGRHIPRWEAYVGKVTEAAALQQAIKEANKEGDDGSI